MVGGVNIKEKIYHTTKTPKKWYPFSDDFQVYYGVSEIEPFYLILFGNLRRDGVIYKTVW